MIKENLNGNAGGCQMMIIGINKNAVATAPTRTHSDVRGETIRSLCEQHDLADPLSLLEQSVSLGGLLHW